MTEILEAVEEEFVEMGMELLRSLHGLGRTPFPRQRFPGQASSRHPQL
jgi:hypothetical protein